MAHLLITRYSPPARTQRQAKIAIALFTAPSRSLLVEQMVIGRYGSSPGSARGKLNLGKFGSRRETRPIGRLRPLFLAKRASPQAGRGSSKPAERISVTLAAGLNLPGRACGRYQD